MRITCHVEASGVRGLGQERTTRVQVVIEPGGVRPTHVLDVEARGVPLCEHVERLYDLTRDLVMRELDAGRFNQAFDAVAGAPVDTPACASDVAKTAEPPPRPREDFFR